MSVKKLDNILQNCDGVLITSPHNLRYFTKFKGGEGVALITKKGRYLFVDSRYTMAASKEAEEFSVIEYDGGRKNSEIMERLGGVRLLAYEDYYLTVNEFKSYKKDFENVEWTAASAEMELLRMVKNDAELSMLRKAEQIGVDAFLNTIPAIKAGVSENEIAAELEYQMRKMGAEGTAFETIVVSGYKSGMPHGKPGGKRLESGDFVTMDFGCVYNGYCSDMTRTVVIGKANSEQKKIYETVKKAQQKGLDSIRAGALCCDSDKAARDVIKEAGYGEYFKHSLGHGVGMLIHELPNLSPRCNIELKENMIVTCEPGIYLQSGGVRIEDMVRVTESGCENLTKLSKDLLEIG